MVEQVELVEVGLRDGLQPVATWVPTATKIRLLERLYDAGIRRAEVTAFVSAQAVPQLADAAEILAAARGLEGLDAQVLVPSARRAEAALSAGARHLAFVLSVSEAHNRSNVRRTPAQSVEDFQAIAAAAPPDTRYRINLATAFDCPFDGAVAADAACAVIGDLAHICSDAEIALCDTTGRATPDRVSSLFATVKRRFPEVRAWAFHGHDTYGLGVANALAALWGGAGAVDASVAGLGGCPFAPGATGNVATEDLVWTCAQMGIVTGIDLRRLLDVALNCAALPGAASGGRVREALAAASRRKAATP